MSRIKSINNFIHELSRYNACDVSDALLKHGVKNGGFLPDILPRTHLKTPIEEPIIGRAWTVRFAEKSSTEEPNFRGHYIDQVPASLPGRTTAKEEWPVVMVLGAPNSLTCAVLGGIMALRASLCHANAIVVSGRVRDLAELDATDNAPVFSRGLSTVGAGAGSKVVSIGTSCEVTDYGSVKTGDVVFIDSNGVVVIPDHVDVMDLIKTMATLTTQDDKVKESVKAGMTVEAAFKQWRQ